ncbi:hypothetical protein B0H19DRAFT_1370243 [Mycena capillaripes]|nr:hypothetical protein B0H19DRAFT_1370243 [Mycena capillaripes]
MKFSLFVTLSAASTALAATFSRDTLPPTAGIKTVSAATYKAIANGTLSIDDIPTIAASFARDVLQKRDAGNVYFCTAANWQLYCVYITDAGPDECVNLGPDLNDQVSSVGPDPNQYCTLFDGSNCDFITSQLYVRSPGYADLSQSIYNGEGGGLIFNDRASSYKCHYDFF